MVRILSKGLLAAVAIIGILAFGLFITKELLKEKVEGAEVDHNLSKIKVAVVYERVTDGMVTNRSVEDVISLLKEMGVDFVFRGWWRWTPCPNRCEDLPSSKARMRCE
ncbi:MAG: hypothetical protein DRN92_04145, partial [Thermoproteota archaeon]